MNQDSEVSINPRDAASGKGNDLRHHAIISVNTAKHNRVVEPRTGEGFFLLIPGNIHIDFIPPYTSEMNPIEQIWKELRKCGFRNEVFPSLEAVVKHLCDVIRALSKQVIRSITARDRIMSMF